MRNEKISEKVENGGKKNKIVNLFYSMKHAHFIRTPLKIEIALRKTVECFFIPFCCFVYLQSLPRYLPKYIYLFILPLCEKCRLKCRDKANSCLIIRFSSSTSEEYPALGCFFLLCLRLRLLLHLLLRFLFNFLVCLASHDATATATAEAAAGNAQRRQQSVGEGQLERGGVSVREREGEGPHRKEEFQVPSSPAGSQALSLLFLYSFCFFFILFYLL